MRVSGFQPFTHLFKYDCSVADAALVYAEIGASDRQTLDIDILRAQHVYAACTATTLVKSTPRSMRAARASYDLFTVNTNSVSFLRRLLQFAMSVVTVELEKF